jgi:glycosyltransferase involved in cell wall biosynthesis
MNIGFEAKRAFHNKTGLGNYSRDLITLLSKHFPENNFYLYNPKSPKNKLFNENNQNVFEKNPTSSFYKKFKNLWRQFGVTNDLIDDKIQIYHGLSGEIPFGLHSKNIKSIVTIHDLIFMKIPELYSFWDAKIHYFKFKKAAQNADIIVAISQQTKNDIIEILKINPDKIKVIYQGCHSIFKETFSEIEKKEVLKKHNLPLNFILNVGTIETRKNVLLAVKAIKNIDTVLIIVGKETNYCNIVKKYILENNMQDKVIFLKGLTLKELAILYQSATIFVYPSHYEGFGIPIIEALYSKTPVITTAGGVFPEAGGPNSVYINPNSVSEMETAINTLLKNPDLCQKIAENGTQFVQKFNDSIIANLFNEIYVTLK